jgi:hypothetical protein
MLSADKAESGLIPSRSIPTVLFSISNGAKDTKSFWKKMVDIDSTLQEYFQVNKDQQPLLEGIGDGLLVISWEYHCIESFQEYQPVTFTGTAVRHNGRFAVDDDPVLYELSREWHIIDHHFEEIA